MKEIEAKLKLKDFSIIEKADLIKIKEVRVLDIYFDNDFLNLKSQDKVFRLRTENDKCFIAFKGAREKHNDLIVREEIESEIASFEDALSIVKNLELREIAKAEKVRTYFSVGKFPSLSVTVDRYPFIGNFIELEGTEKEVYALLKELNFDLEDTIQKNCAELFVEYCEENKISFDFPEKHFTFLDEEEYDKKNDNL